MADLINREEAKEAVKYVPWCDWKAVGDSLDSLPAVDAVEVVRCEDCNVPHNKWTGCPMLNGLVTPPDFYCGLGERREEKEANT